MHASLVDWANWLRAYDCSEATIRTRTGNVRTLQNHARLPDPRHVTTGQVVDWLADCRNGSTRHTYWMSAHMWCEYLVATEQRSDNPMHSVHKPRQPRGLPRPVSQRVVRKVLTNPPGHRSYAYVTLACFAGLRVHEIAKIRGEDIDWDIGWMYVLGKGGQEAAVPMHERVLELAKGMPDVGQWFPGTHAGHVAPDTVSRVMRNAFRAVGSAAKPHQCRHYFGSEVLRASGNARVAQELLRHRSLATTQRYTEVTRSDMVDAIRGLGWVA